MGFYFIDYYNTIPCLLEVDHFGCKIKVSKENYYLASVPPGTVE